MGRCLDEQGLQVKRPTLPEGTILAQFVWNPHRPVRLVIEDNNRGDPIGRNHLQLFTVDSVVDGHTRTADLGNPGTNRNRVRIVELAPIIARDRSKDWTKATAIHEVTHLALLNVGNPRRFEPAERNDVVYVPKGILIAPLDRQLYYHRVVR